MLAGHRETGHVSERAVRVVVAHELVERVAAELAQRLRREHERDHRLRDDARGRDRGDVGAFLERDRLFLRLDVDGLQHRTVQRGERLHRDARDEQVAGGHAAFDAAGVRGLAAVLARVGVPADRVVRLAAAHAGDREALADLDRLHRLDAHQRLREQAVDATIPVHVRTEPGRHAVAEHLDHSAERVAGLRRLFDLADHVGFGVGIEAAHLGRVDLREVVGRRAVRDRRGRGAELHHVAQHRDVAGARATPWRPRRPRRAPRSRAPTRARARRGRRRSRTSACPRGRRGRGGAGSAATRCGPGADDISSAHFPVAHSLLRIRIASGLPSVRPWRTPPRNSTSSFSKRMRGPAAVAEPPARELVGDVVDQDRETGGQALDGDHQRRSVGLARRQEPQHGASWGGGALAAPPSRRSDHRDSTAAPATGLVVLTPGWRRRRRSAPARRSRASSPARSVPGRPVVAAAAAAGWLKMRPGICTCNMSPTNTAPGVTLPVRAVPRPRCSPPWRDREVVEDEEPLQRRRGRRRSGRPGPRCPAR